MIFRPLFAASLMAFLLSGCADVEEGAPVSDRPADTGGLTVSGADEVGSRPSDQTEDKPATVEEDFDLKPLSTSAGASGNSDSADSHEKNTPLAREERIRAVMAKLKPLQVMLGQWRGTTRKEFENFKAVDSHEWIWDLQSNPDQPSLSMTSDKSPYLRAAKLTWDPQKAEFQLTTTDADEVQRSYTGDYTDPVHEVVGSDDKLHRVFRLELTETPESAAETGAESWQLAFAQQENNRYLLEVSKRRGSAPYRRYDTVSTQREGTSFAINDSDYGEKTCVISQGLGTTAVSYKGKTYWVCCSGCKAAFEEDPETWIARASKRAAEKK